MTDQTKWEVFDKDALVVEYARLRRQRLRDAIGEFISDDDASVEEMVEVIKTEITEWLEHYQKGYDKCQESLQKLQQI